MTKHYELIHNVSGNIFQFCGFALQVCVNMADPTQLSGVGGAGLCI
jgi:hypothetical protein